MSCLNPWPCADGVGLDYCRVVEDVKHPTRDIDLRYLRWVKAQAGWWSPDDDISLDLLNNKADIIAGSP